MTQHYTHIAMSVSELNQLYFEMMPLKDSPLSLATVLHATPTHTRTHRATAESVAYFLACATCQPK